MKILLSFVSWMGRSWKNSLWRGSMHLKVQITYTAPHQLPSTLLLLQFQPVDPLVVYCLSLALESWPSTPCYALLVFDDYLNQGNQFSLMSEQYLYTCRYDKVKVSCFLIILIALEWIWKQHWRVTTEMVWNNSSLAPRPTSSSPLVFLCGLMNKCSVYTSAFPYSFLQMTGTPRDILIK